ncbi:hypothetical protein FIBSPDRAFT_1050579 [Athelia psychrophila]|uniref:G-protein coupled receptors family 1 profile domain-containing protein n=1 Tax=Athelia psychrophila TaxID=1759441 RepID=A0A166AIX8_9AGAM|nr:hypothetical protein FIBSPDRAFT_1050579 [Fibularhizoctonia sp. CBS 109695]
MSTFLEAAWRRQLVTYVFMANTTVYAYDWVLSVSDEVVLVSVGGLSWPIAIYFLSRATLFVLMCLTLIFRWLPVAAGDCDAFVKIFGVCAALSIASTSFLFLLRVRTVYLRSTRITVVFGTLWLVSVAFTTGLITKLHAKHLSLNGYPGCSTTKATPIAWLLAPILLNDTSVFLAITYRLTADAATKSTWRSQLLSIVKGKGLYSLSRSLMRTGQLYYLSTIAYILVHFAILWQPPAPAGAIYLLGALYAGYTNMMACRVFRGVALGTMHMAAPSAGLTSTRIAAAFELDLLSPPKVSSLP